ncbi:Hsp20/alpha crystallin family protein [Marinicrinis sediminis]|uniref:Hsp20/alpha crystallin family protein n=1 Tax=Marinicrinis sediminis TaxID=1652465 RepID=A0ABW5RAW8_9BACL
MDVEKLKQWIQFAQNIQGGDFWNQIFDEEQTRSFMNGGAGQGIPFTMNPMKDGTGKSSQAESPVPTPFPRIDVYKSHQYVYVLVELPGIAKQDIELSLQGGQLMLRGQVSAHYQDVTIVQQERYQGHFERTVRLPESVDIEQLAASFENGVLEITIPRQKEPAQSIHID